MLFRDYTLCLLLIAFIDVGIGLRCLSCKGTLEPWLCNIAETCAPGENACGLRHYKGVGGELRYDTFCSTDTICSNTYHNTSLCDSCCHGDICNSRGCSSSGIPNDRGLICYNCNQVADLSKCAELAFCDKGDRCAVYKEYVSGRLFYSSKCLPPSRCFEDSIIFGKRQSSQTLCGSTCCHSDLCNDNCNDTLMTPPSTIETGFSMEFLLMFPLINPSYNLYVFISSMSPGHLDVEVPYISTKKTIPLTTGRNYLIFNSTMMMSPGGTGVEHKGIYLKSSVPVTVFAIADRTDDSFDPPLEETEGFMVLPVKNLGRQYRLVRGGHDKDFQIINIASLSDNTEVTVQFEISYGYVVINGHRYDSGDSYTVTLQRLETLCVYHFNITGTTIRSDKPIAVVGGSRYSYYSNNPTIEFLPPVSALGTTFIIPSFPESSWYHVRVMLATDGQGAVVNLTDISGTRQYTLDYTDTYEMSVDTVPSFIASTRPVYVTVKTYSNETIQPTLVSIPSVSNYRNSYNIPSPNSVMPHDFDQYAVVVIPSSKQNGLMVNNVRVHSTTSNATLLVNSTDYTLLTIPMNEPHIVITHVDSSVKFGAFVFGKSQSNPSLRNARYAFPAGFQ